MPPLVTPKWENCRGLVGHWNYHGNVSALGTVYDISGNGNNGTLVDNAFVDNQGVNLDGIGDYVYFDGKILIPSLSDWTFLCWFKNSETSGNILFSQYTPTNNAGRILILRSGGSPTQAALFIGDIGGYPSKELFLGTIDNSNWNFIAVTRSGKDFKGYLNSSTVSYSDTDSGRQLLQVPSYIGQRGDGVEYFKGIIDNTKIYNRALSEPEIVQIQNSTKGR